MHIKTLVYQHIKDDSKTKIGSVVSLFIVLLILINVIVIIIDTFNMPTWYFVISEQIELFSIIIFTIEYVLRLWTSDLKYPNSAKLYARLKYSISFMAIIDLLAIVPFYLPLLFPVDLRVLRTFRLIRLLRLFKINRYTKALSSIATVFINKSNQLLSSLIIVSLLIIIASITMYNLEHPVQPDVFQNAFSGIWWAVATLTTVGYGDIYPITDGGKIMAGIIAILGIGLVAVPTGIISAGFVEMIDNSDVIVNHHKKSYQKRRDRLPKFKR